MGVDVELVLAPTPEATELLAELDELLGALYEPLQRHGLSSEELFQSNIRFFLAREQGEPLGCGGVALYPGYAEVKRMYTRERARRRGVGNALLARIEAAARNAGQRVLRLETGIHQLAAISLYEGCGFQRRGPFGHYTDLPKDRIAKSIFYEKLL